jgi:hypothetical protein
MFWFLWFAASWVGGLLYVIPVSVVHFVLGLDRLNDPSSLGGLGAWMPVLAAVLCGAACGSTIGLGQWLVLRSYLARIGLWVATTIAGYASIGLLPLIANVLQPGWSDWAFTLIIAGKMHWLARVDPSWPAASWLPGAITLTMFGAVLGIAQWLVLRNRVDRAGWWIAISAGGWACAAAMSFLPPVLAVLTSFDLPIIVAAAGMVWLLNGAQTSRTLLHS